MDLKYLKHIALYILSAIVSVLIIAYIGYHIYISFNANIETIPCEVVTRYDTTRLNAYIVRNENILYSSTPGDVSYLYNDGDKVGANVAVANIYGTVKDSGIRKQIMDIDEKISILESSNMSSGITASDLSAIDNQINNIYYSIRTHVESGDIEYALRTRNEMLVLLNKRKIIVQNVTDYNDKIAALEQKKANLTSSLSAVTETVKTNSSGYFYSTLDGYENIFKTDIIEDITLSSFNELITSAPSTESSLEIGKIVEGFKWYIMCVVNQENLRYFVEGHNYSVVFPYSGDTEITMTLEKTDAPSGEENALLVLSTNNIPKDFNYLRMQTVEIVQQNYTGFHIPISAIRISDGVQGVYILEGEVVRFRKIDILFESDGYCIVSEKPSNDEDSSAYLSKNDIIITKGKNLYDGRIIE